MSEQTVHISLEAALAHNRVIGAGGKIPWELPVDRKHWRSLVRGHALIVGQATYAQQGSLEDSINIVVTKNADLVVPEGLAATSIDQALELARQHETSEIFVVGGASIFEQTIAQADKLYLTLIDLEVPNGDRFFPEYEHDFEIIREEPGSDNGLNFKFVELARKV